MKIFTCSFLFCTLFSSATSSNLRTRLRKLNTLQFDELKLINADSELEVNAKIKAYDTNTINVEELINMGAPNMTLRSSFNINATVSGGEKVEVTFDNGQVERQPYYARCGNRDDNFFPCRDLKLGKTTNITAKAVDTTNNNEVFVWAVLVFIDGTSAPTTQTPTMAPTVSPAPTTETTPEPTMAPTEAPVTMAPTARTPCDEDFCPYFDGPWETSVRYPLKVTEAQGGMMGEDIVVIGGFEAGFANVTRKNYARNLTDPKAPWRQLDDMPVEGGITHAGFAIVNNTLLYMCGGYIGAAPGPQTDICLLYNHSAPSGSQWSNFTSLPDKRGGGGMVYSSVTNQLIFSAGGQRPNEGYALTVDYTTTWVYSLDNPSLGWVQKADIPYHANHVGFVTAHDDQNRERLFFLGGHKNQDKNKYVKSNYEWDAISETWIKRADMLIPGGHVSSSTIPVGNGFLIAGGSTNNVPGSKISDVYYYDIPSDSWHFIGHLNLDVNTPICGFGADNYFHCYTGTPGSFPAYKRRLIVPS